MNETCMDGITKRIRAAVSRFDAVIFGSAFLMTLLVHLYMFTNKFINHDDVQGLYDDCAFGLSSGRFSLHLMSGLTGKFSSPWLNGVLGALFLALTVTVFLKIFEIRHYPTALLTAFVMVTVPTVVSTYTYMFCAWQYFFAMATACVGAWCIRHEKLPWMAAGAALIAFGMGCYQSYFGFAAAILVTVLILDLCRNRWEGRALPCLLTGIKYVVSLAAAMALYFIILKVCLAVTGTVLTDYQGISGMGQITPGMLLSRIGDAYVRFGAYFFCSEAYDDPVFTTVLACLCMAAGLFGVILSAIREKLHRHPGSLVLLIVLVLLFPLSCNLAYVMTDWKNVHMVMVYPLVMLYLLPAFTAEHFPVKREKGENGTDAHTAIPRAWEKTLVCLMLVLTLLVGYECAVTANAAYFAMDMTYENVYAFYTKLTAKIEMMPGFTRETPVVLFGKAVPDGFFSGPDITGVLVGKPAFNVYSRFQLLYYFIGCNYRFVPSEHREALKQTETYAYMPCYPDEGSIQWIDGVIVVKLSQEY